MLQERRTPARHAPGINHVTFLFLELHGLWSLAWYYLGKPVLFFYFGGRCSCEDWEWFGWLLVRSQGVPFTVHEDLICVLSIYHLIFFSIHMLMIIILRCRLHIRGEISCIDEAEWLSRVTVYGSWTN